MERKLEQGLEEIDGGFRPRQCHSAAKDQASRKERGLRLQRWPIGMGRKSASIIEIL